jgi:GntR family transcriptional regulator
VDALQAAIMPVVTTAHTLLPSSGTTLYSQLASVLRGRIGRGEWPVGHEIPTLDELSEQYGVARVSARQAVQMLVNEGLLSARRGRRTVVISGGQYERTLSTGVAAPHEQLPNFAAKILDKVEDVPLPAFATGLGKAEKSYVRIHKIDCDGPDPYAVSFIYIAKSVYRSFPRHGEERVKLSRLVRGALAAPLLSARERIMVAAASHEEATALKCPISAPVAVVQRVYCDAEGRIVYAGWSVYRGDRFLVDRELSELVQPEGSRAVRRPDTPAPPSAPAARARKVSTA